MSGPDVYDYDHLRPSGAHYHHGIYRVVGVDEEAVTLLQVGDGDGHESIRVQ